MPERVASRGRHRPIQIALGLLLLFGIGYLTVAFSGTVQAANARVTGKADAIPTRFGRMEFVVAGRGTPILMIHGTGGGFDQSLTFTEAIRRRGHEIIAPSRFGYLGTDYPELPSSENQADAFVELLDRLGIKKLAVAGGSAGALSATQFALRHPDRTSALVLLVPAANVRGRDPARKPPAQEWVVRRILKSDFLFWALLNTVPDRLIETLLATDPSLLPKVSPHERARAYRILREIMPIERRWRGMLNDAELAGNPAKMHFARISVPTLVISVEDDRFGTARTARDIAAVVPKAQLKIFPNGGHIWLGHDEEVAETVSSFVVNASASQ